MDDIEAVLQAQAAEIARAGHAGWGNTMRDAAAEIRALRAAVLAEREQCAVLCDRIAADQRRRADVEGYKPRSSADTAICHSDQAVGAAKCARAIRGGTALDAQPARDGPVLSEEMRAYARRLQAHPEEARAFLQRAGILGPDGKLAPPYCDDAQPARRGEQHTAVVYVCPDKDIECGRDPARWCSTCPLRARRGEQHVEDPDHGD